ncbi:hypothetical protein LT330_001942 [Penicillium expansum]|nr:hypothetical protein LT330_001942 [Penicillium expansum]
MAERDIPSDFRTIGGIMVIPAPIWGTGQLPPGACTNQICLLSWGCAREGRYIKSKLLQLLSTMALRREPVLGEKILCRAFEFHEKIGRNIANVEAAYIQRIGRMNEQEYESCLKDKGPFNVCVMIDTLGWPKECANCHWKNRSELCNFYKAPGPKHLVIPQGSVTAPVASSHLYA